MVMKMMLMISMKMMLKGDGLYSHTMLILILSFPFFFITLSLIPSRHKNSNQLGVNLQDDFLTFYVRLVAMAMPIFH